MSAGPPATQAGRVSPYKGLAPYSADDTSFFFGRERERDVVIANLRARHLTVVYGESGVGKSSLLHAGVLSELRKQARLDLEDSETPEFIPVVFSSWRDDPTSGLLEAVRSSVAEILPDRELGPVGDAELTAMLQQWARELDCEFLVILDQFEEYFLYHGHEQGEGTFDSQFPHALTRTELRASFLVAIREDAFAKLDRFKTRVPGLLENFLRIRHLDERAAGEAIRGPLEAWNESVDEAEKVTADAALVKAVLDDVRSGIRPGEQSGHGVIEHDGYEIKEGRVEAPYLQLVLTRLWDEEMRLSSKRLRPQTLEQLGGAERIVQNHLDEAMGALPADEQELAAAAFYYLVTPEGSKIAQSIETLAAYSRHSAKELAEVLEKLTTGGVRILRPVAPPPGTAGGTRYEIFHDVLAPAVLDWRARIERERLERERERAERKRAEAQEQARIQQLRARAFRALAVLLGVLLVGGIGVWVISERRAADRKREEAQSRQLARSATLSVSTDPELSVLLAREAVELRHTADAEEALREALLASRVRVAYRGHRGQVSSAAFSPDGRLVLTGSDDRTARLWQGASGKVVKVLRGHGSYVSSAAFSRDGKLVASASWDRTARVWNAASGRTIHELGGHRAGVNWADFSPNDKMLVTAGRDRTVRLWDLTTGRIRAVLRGHRDVVNTAVFSPDGRFVVSSSRDETARIWRVATGRTTRVLRGHTNYVNAASFSADGSHVVTAGSDGLVRIWDAGTGRAVMGLRGRRDDVVTTAAFSGDGKRVVTASLDQTARVWDLSSGRTVVTMRGHAGPILSASFGPGDKYVLTSGLDQTARLWAVSPPAPTLRHNAAVNSAEFSHDGKLVATAAQDGAARVGDPSRWTSSAILRSGALPLYDATISLDGNNLLTVGEDGVARMWDLPAKRVIRRFPVKGAPPLYGAAFSPNGASIVLAASDGTARLFDTRTGEHGPALLADKKGETPVNAVAFSPDGELVATAGRDARIFDAGSGREIAALREVAQLQEDLSSVAFSPDGELLATAGEGSVKLWDLSRELLLASLPTGHADSVEFSPDGKLILTTDTAGRIVLWDRATRRSIGVLAREAGEVLQASFDPGGERIVTAGPNNVAKMLPCEVCAPLDDLVELASKRVTRELTAAERRQYLTD